MAAVSRYGSRPTCNALRLRAIMFQKAIAPVRSIILSLPTSVSTLRKRSSSARALVVSSSAYRRISLSSSLKRLLMGVRADVIDLLLCQAGPLRDIDVPDEAVLAIASLHQHQYGEFTHARLEG